MESHLCFRWGRRRRRQVAGGIRWSKYLVLYLLTILIVSHPGKFAPTVVDSAGVISSDPLIVDLKYRIAISRHETESKSLELRKNE
ncbi:unnamed protein product [Linum trigynum]|uniref:Uncharacterized protein n=1 Tax=Linum trigynum TaxID=586398 RepID=A0AAV2F7L1_9ROSI